ncbi:M20 metallopeptidase family protein [Brevibacillus ginsengisoli]|uniref:M20 metallopeptidase family protein n=1 Tax=Brevibacillus ginsengisoli TaxID=363854 RepID=UPI003CE86C7E
MMMNNQRIWQESQRLLPWLREIRRDFHQYPELGLEEFRTRDQIVHYLTELNIPCKVVAKTGVLGWIEGTALNEQSAKGRTVALRADMDALPILEQNNISYRSTADGKMHACGHDVHMTVQLGVARILSEQRENFSGTVKLLFQPAEETVGGAVPMIQEGVLDNPQVDAIFGLHVAPDLPVGHIGVKYGQMNASSDTLHLKIRGENAHGAYPHMGRDAIVIAAQVIVALQTVVSRNVDPRQSAVVSLGTIQGGTQGNIMAGEVRLTGTVRTLDARVRTLVKQRVREVAQLTAQGLGGEAIVEWEEGYTSLVNHSSMVDLVNACGENLLGKEKVRVNEWPSLGVEDFAFFLERVPGAFYQLGCRNETLGITYPLHHPRFGVDEGCLAIGAAMQVCNVLSFLRMENMPSQ